MVIIDYEISFWDSANIFQYLVAITGSLGMVSSGMLNGWSSPSLPQLLSPNSSIPTTSSEGSWLAVMPLIGSTVGSTISFFLVDTIGRKGVLLLAGVPLAVGWIMVGFSTTVIHLMISRILTGTGGGLVFSSLPMYLAEISDPKTRGLLTSIITISWYIGVFMVDVIGFYFNITTTAFISASIPLIMILTFMWMPESFYYHIMKGNVEEARRSLKAFRPHSLVESELIRIGDAVKEQNKNEGTFWDLIKIKSNRKAILITYGLFNFQQMSGPTAIIYYLKIIFMATEMKLSLQLLSSLYILLLIIVSCVSCSVVDKVGRRPLSMISSSGSTFALVIVGGYFYLRDCTGLDVTSLEWIPCAFLMVYVIVFSVGMLCLPTIMLGELFPTNMKRFAFPLSATFFTNSALVAAKMFQILDDNYGIFMPFCFYACNAALSIIFNWFCLPETKGKNLEEIQELLKM